MRKIVYYVASSLDGFIAGPDEDISKFVGAGNGVEKYLHDLAAFDTVIMGRRTYEFGYKFGLEPGKPAYPHMKHYIFSNTLQFENPGSNVVVLKPDLVELNNLQQASGTDIYLCGGGLFAGWLLENQCIDIVKIKLNPLILGSGTRLFGNTIKTCKTVLQDAEQFEHGLQILTYKVTYD